MAFELVSYISGYSGYTQVKRLLSIAQNKSLRVESITLAIAELKKGINTQLYKEIFEKNKDLFEGENKLIYDESWVNQTDSECQRKLDKLELELNSYRTNMIRDGIRNGNNELGSFYLKRGDLQNSLKCFLRARDFCSSPKHVVEMCLNVILVSLETANYSLVAQYVSKAETTILSSKKDEIDPLLASKLNVAHGIALLDQKKYKLAAKKFIWTNFNLGTTYNEVVTPQDIAIYGALMALASFDRSELKQQVMEDSNFKQFIELVPDIHTLLTSFYDSKYSLLLNTLDKLTPLISIDIHLMSHVEGLMKSIRDKALCQYCHPFVSVDMNKMSKTFNTDVAHLEEEVARLIQEKQIKARIDSHNKILYAKIHDQRDVTFQSVQDLGDKYQNETEKGILRMSMLKHPEFAVKPSKKTQGNHGPPPKK
jgi:COP9 signalosome complex subunit 1